MSIESVKLLDTLTLLSLNISGETKVKAKSKEAKVFEVALFKKPIVKGKPKVGRPRTYVETKMNKTIRLSQTQINLIYSNFQTLQGFIEHYFSKLEKEVERKQARKLNLIA